MNDTAAQTRSVVVEREFAHPPEKIWRALTQPHLIEAWLMKNAFAPVVGHRFEMSAEWGAVRCEVLTVDPPHSVAYSWGDDDLQSVVTWTLTRTPAGTLLRMEQTGFRNDQPRYFHGARAGWPMFIDRLEQVVAQLD